MKTLVQIVFLLVFAPGMLNAQITTPIIKANFGVDADLRSNFFNGLVQSGNDDWFWLPGSIGTGQFIVDTTGAAALLANYSSNPNSRKLPFYRQMRFPPYSVVNNRLLVDAYFVRDYHGDDSTIFASGSNKNGMNPSDWSCPVSQSIPDKNEILDMMLHVRRAGPNVTDSMWLFGGISIENTTGNRYFDFEMYQTDIYYDRTTRRFYNYGPDAGHTRWQFDASGNMTAPGDIILTAEYSSSALSFIEARIWVNRNDLSLTPAAFNWSGSFDGEDNGAQFGYAGIQPKTAGAFYTGLQSVNNTWTGPFSLVLGDNSIVTNYTAKQFMEFSVNLSKLGLDDAKIFGGDDCLMPFRRVIVKTRASTSFTSELKDFVAPFDFFMAPMAAIETATPFICDTGGVSHIYVSNPIPTSIYQWSTPNGHIIGSSTGPFIFVDTPGVYIVTQQLQAACSVYATDTVTIGSLGACDVLSRNLVDFNSTCNNGIAYLTWKVLENQYVDYFIIERSFDGQQFEEAGKIFASDKNSGSRIYSFTDDVTARGASYVFYRVRLRQQPGSELVSRTIRHDLTGKVRFALQASPNPAKNNFMLRINAGTETSTEIQLYNQQGVCVLKKTVHLMSGNNIFDVDIPPHLPNGYYLIKLPADNTVFTEKLVILR